MKLCNRDPPRALYGKLHSSIVHVYVGVCFRYLIAARWMDQWKAYVGSDKLDWNFAGKTSGDVNPGPIDNSNLFKGMYIATLYLL